MKKIVILLIFIIIASSYSWAQKDSLRIKKSIENKVFKAKKSKGRIIRGNQIFNTSVLPITIDLSKKEYDQDGLLLNTYYPNSKGKYFAEEKNYYNDQQELIRNVIVVFDLNDSIVSTMTRDSKGNILKIISDKNTIGDKGWFNKSYVAPYGNQEYFNFYLTSNDSINLIVKEEFNKKYEELKFNIHQFCRLIDVDNDILINKVSYLTVPLIPPLDNQMDTINERYEYIKGENKKIKEFLNTKERKSFYKGKTRMTINTTKEIYNYNLQDSLIEKTITVSNYQEHFSKGKEPTTFEKVYKETYEYLDKSVKTYYYDENGNIERTRTVVLKPEKEEIYEWENKKRIFKYNEKGNLTSIKEISTEKNKTNRDIQFQYTYNDYGDWTSCVYYNNLKGKPQFIEERVIEYY
jgi:hypothetical protein